MRFLGTSNKGLWIIASINNKVLLEIWRGKGFLWLLPLITERHELLVVDERKFWSGRTSETNPRTRTMSASCIPGKAPCFLQYPLEDRKHKSLVEFYSYIHANASFQLAEPVSITQGNGGCFLRVLIGWLGGHYWSTIYLQAPEEKLNGFLFHFAGLL